MFVALDESGIHQGSPWMAFGALWIPNEDEALPRLEADAMEIRLRHRYWSEFKWSKLGARYIDAYREFVEATLRIPDLRFTVMVLESSTVDPARLREFNGEGGKPLAYLKFMSLLLRHRIGPRVGEGHRLFTLVYDDVAGRQELKDEFDSVLRNDLANAAAAQRVTGCEYSHISKGNSAALHALQAVDLLTGAARAAWMESPPPTEDERARRVVLSQIESWAGTSLASEGGGVPVDVWRCRLPQADPTDPVF